MKVMNVYRCLPFLMLAVGTARGSVEEIKKFDPDIEEYLSKRPKMRPLFEKATPEKIERWRQCNQRFDELDKEREEVREEYLKIEDEYKEINKLWDENNDLYRRLNELRGERLKRSQDMIKNESSGLYFEGNLCIDCSKDYPYKLSTDLWDIFPSLKESALQKRISENYAQESERRKALNERRAVLDQRDKEIDAKYDKVLQEYGILPKH